MVERIRVPPVAHLEPSAWLGATIEDLELAREPGEPIGMIDDAISEHPLETALQERAPAWASPGLIGQLNTPSDQVSTKPGRPTGRRTCGLARMRSSAR